MFVPSRGWKACVALFLLVTAAGCGGAKGEVKGQAYERDGMLGITSANPNLPVNPTYHNYSTDVKYLREAIGRIPEVEDSTILMNGPTVYVTLELRDGIDLERSMRIRNSAQASLQRLMPRYDVQVSVGRSRALQ